MQVYINLHMFEKQYEVLENSFRKIIMIENQTKKAKRATQFIFLVCGLAISSWAPMVPYVSIRPSKYIF